MVMEVDSVDVVAGSGMVTTEVDYWAEVTTEAEEVMAE